jgi:hypothetical protein
MTEKPNLTIEEAKELLVRANTGGRLARFIFKEWRGFENSDPVVAAAIELHNIGAIDFLDITLLEDSEFLKGSTFFTGQYFYCAAIPQLKADITTFMMFVEKLVALGGQDMASNQPNGAFLEWCKQDNKRAEEVIARAKAGDNLAVRFLTFALTAANSRQAALEMIASESQEIRLSAITALGRIRHENVDDAVQAIQALKTVVTTHSDDAHRQNAVASVSGVFAQHKEIDHEALNQALHVMCATPGPRTVHQLAQTLWEHASALDRSSLEIVVQAICSVKPENKGTIGSMRLGIDKLFTTANADLGCDLVFALLNREDDPVEAEELKEVGQKLTQTNQSIFLSMLVGCFLSGNRNACEWIKEGLNNHSLPNGLSEVLKTRKLNDTEHYFLCRKAIGYLFFQPVIACEVILAVIEVAEPATADKCGELLFDPMAINYSGSVLDHLKLIPSSSLAYPQVVKAIDQWEEYIKGIQAANEVKELKPSEHHRFIERKRNETVMRSSHKEAEKHSIFLNLVHRSTVLHGMRTVTHVKQMDGSIRPVEMELQSHGVTMELPRLSILEEHELNYILRVFRAEKFKV